MSRNLSDFRYRDNKRNMSIKTCFSYNVSFLFTQPHLNIKHEPEEIIIDVNNAPEPLEENQAQSTLNLRRNYRRKSDGMHDLFHCDHCEKTYLTKIRLQHHVQQKHFNPPFKKKPSKKFFCKLCKVLVLKFHLNTFHSHRTFDCDLCSFSTKYSANLKIHKDSVSKTSYLIIFCVF